MWHRYWWLIIIILLVVGIIIGFLVFKKNKKGDSTLINSNQTKFEVFPVKMEDFIVPPKMYGLWAYGVKGKTSSDHNEGHPGWDFEMKKGSKVYAIADLEIEQIHDGDQPGAGVNPQVIEAFAKLSDSKYHIVYHSVINLESDVKVGAIIKAGEPLAEVGMPLSNDSAMIHFGIFPPHDSVGACPANYFADNLQPLINQIVANSIDANTGKPFVSACIGKINKTLYLQNYPDRQKDLGGAEVWE